MSFEVVDEALEIVHDTDLCETIVAIQINTRQKVRRALPDEVPPMSKSDPTKNSERRRG